MKKLMGILLAASMVFSLAACGSSSSNDSSSSSDSSDSDSAQSGDEVQTFKLGSIGPLTGDAAIYGQAVKNAEELAVKEINAANGSDVFEWKFEDDEHDAEKSVNAYMNMICRCISSMISTHSRMGWKMARRSWTAYGVNCTAASTFRR